MWVALEWALLGCVGPKFLGGFFGAVRPPKLAETTDFRAALTRIQRGWATLTLHAHAQKSPYIHCALKPTFLNKIVNEWLEIGEMRGSENRGYAGTWLG